MFKGSSTGETTDYLLIVAEPKLPGKRRQKVISFDRFSASPEEELRIRQGESIESILKSYGWEE